MSLTISSQLSLQGALYSTVRPTPTAATSLASAISSQFYAQQASLILNRVTSETRTQLYQETLTHQLDLERASHSLLSSPGHDPVFADRDFTSSDSSVVRGYAKLWATPQTFQIEVFSVGTGAGATTYAIDNGATVSADSPKIELDDGSTVLWLLDTTSSPVTITVSEQTSSISAAIQDFVDIWNESFSFLTTNPGEITTPLAADFNTSVGGLLSGLRDVGLTRGATGQFAVDEDTLEEAISGNLDRVRNLISGPGGLAVTARRISRDFLQEPARYVTHPTNPVASAALRWMSYYETRGMLINTMG